MAAISKLCMGEGTMEIYVYMNKNLVQVAAPTLQMTQQKT
jgi:hypothetical protein